MTETLFSCYFLFLFNGSVTDSENYRTIEWFGLAGILEIIWFQCTCLGQGHLSLRHIVQNPIQPGTEHFQGSGIHHFSRQPVLVRLEKFDNVSNSLFPSKVANPKNCWRRKCSIMKNNNYLMKC